MKLSKMTIGKKLWLLTAVGILAVGCVVGTSHHYIKKLVERIDNTSNEDLPRIRHSLTVSIAHDKIRAAVFRGIFASQIQIEEELAEAHKELKTAEENILSSISSLKEVSTDPESTTAVEKTAVNVEGYLKIANQIFDLLKQNKTTFALELQADFQAEFEKVNASLALLKESTDKSVAESLSETESIVKIVNKATNSISGIGVLISLLLSFFIIKDLMKTLLSLISRLSEQESTVRNYTFELESISKNLSESTSDQASAVEQTATSLEEISAMVEKSAEHSRYLTENSQKSIKAADNGVTAVEKMLEAMSKIGDSSQDMMVKFEENNQRILGIINVINNISDRTKVINDIVFQTKLLSFNASVEAARAGEHGKGFAVVAHEIGVLATKSGESSKEINELLTTGVDQVTRIIEQNKTEFEQMIYKNSQHVDSGKVVAKSCGESLNLLAKQVSDVSRLTEEISDAMLEQKTGISEINKTIAVFSSSANSCASNSQMASQISVNLKEQFSLLHGQIEELEGLVKGNANKNEDIESGELNSAFDEEDDLKSDSKVSIAS